MANVNPPSTTIEQYREAKNQYLKLKNQAKKELLSRFNMLAAELLQVQRELLDDFGEKVTMPSKSSGVKKPKPLASAPPPPPPMTPPVATPKTASLMKQLDKQKKKMEELKASGKPTSAVEDRIYEIEDEIRLSQQ